MPTRARSPKSRLRLAISLCSAMQDSTRSAPARRRLPKFCGRRRLKRQRSRARLPLDREPPTFHCAITQVQIDQSLIWHARVRSEAFEVFDHVRVETNGHSLLQLLGKRVFRGLGKVIVLSHGDHLFK